MKGRKVGDMENSYLSDKSDVTKVRFISSNHTTDGELSNKLLSEKETSKDKKDDLPPVPFLKLFQYSAAADRVMIALGCFVAVISGAVMPGMIVLFGSLIDKFVGFQVQGEINAMKSNNDNFTALNQSVSVVIINHSLSLNSSVRNLSTEVETFNPKDMYNALISEFREDSTNLSLYIGGIGLSLLLLHYITISFLSIAAENQIYRIKHLFMKCILRQDIGWFDVNETGDFTSRISTDLMRIRDGIGEKISMCIYFSTTSFLCLVFAFYYGWKLTLVILSVMPILIISTAIMAKIQGKVSVSELSAYGKAGAVAEEVFSSIRTVISFGGEEKEIARYEENLIDAKKSGIKRGLLTSIGGSMIWFCIYCSYALGFWYGVRLILESRENKDEEYTAGNLVIVFFNVLTAAMNMGQASPYIEAFVMAKGAAAKIFHIINRVPYIDSSSTNGEKPSKVLGKVEIINVEFSYPARQDVQVLNGLSLEGNPGETVALVGPSGCGKSTIIQLIQRFYDPIKGKALLDGKNIKDINLGWLRKQIGVVGQEPALFATTIAENIRHGFPNASDKDIEKAAKAANAHDFIMKLPKKYMTVVGERGAQLSGGQKQRIAIARALVRNPRILLLDEATSALDTESESVVQSALDLAREGRTTFIVAHRLTTIRNADKIVVINNGTVEETGNHTDLMEKKGLYYQLVTAQQAENIDKEEVYVSKQDVWIRQESVMSMSSCGSRESSGNIHGFKTSIKKKNEEEEDPDVKDADPSKIRLAKLAMKEWPFILFGSCCSLTMGLSVPFYGIIFGDILGTLGHVDGERIKKDSEWFSLLFVIIGIITGSAAFFQTFMFSIAGEKLTLRLRKMVFKTMISQDVAWFDDPKNRTGALCSRLSTDASQVQGATGSRMATVCQAIATLFASVFLALYYSWKVGLVALCFIPLVMLATYFESRIISGHMLQDKDSTEAATKIAVEAIENIRTVASLHEEQSFVDMYLSAISVTHKSVKRRSQIRGLTFGFAQSIPCFAYSVSMYYGSILVSKNELMFGDLFKLAEGIIFGTMMVGQAVAFAPDYQKAKVSAVRIFKLLDLEPTIDAFSPAGQIRKCMKGHVEFQRAGFSYPTRPEVNILRNLSLSIETGQTVALVGSSGCGKSTCIQLIQRFYDALKGQVMIDGMNIKQYNVAWLRSQIGVVSQEPVLFGYSVARNIAYGDNSRFVPMSEIIEAARKANIHDFVSSLPCGYDTNVGDRGTQLSGGQKQRIAIARALVRNPTILLLDEATSALDTESEKVVQEALDQASVGRTTITIAHRLSTIQNADKIVVIHKGCVIEQGTHQQLLSLKGFYHKLHTIQEGKAT